MKKSCKRFWCSNSCCLLWLKYIAQTWRNNVICVKGFWMKYERSVNAQRGLVVSFPPALNLLSGNNVFTRKIQIQNQSKQNSTCFCSCSLAVTVSNDVAAWKPEKEQRRRQKKHICISKMIINPKKKPGKEWAILGGTRGRILIALEQIYPIPTGTQPIIRPRIA